MFLSYVKLGIAALLPVALSAIFYLLSKYKNFFSRLPYAVKQVLIGVAFGALACVGTHWGIEMNGAMVNARDAAVLTAGLMFGSPAGIIAGFIGGLERYLATAIWGIGSFTVIACSVSTFLAGIYAAALRRYMFDNRRPGWLIALAIGVIMEVFHLMMVFVTNISETAHAMSVVRICTLPMLAANGVSVMLSAVVISLIAHERHRHDAARAPKISKTIQRELLVTVTLTFAIIFVFIAMFQTGSAKSQADSYLKMALEEVTDDIHDTSDSSILRIAREAAADHKNGATMQELVERYALAEANYVNAAGIITSTSVDEYLYYNMASQEQSAEFLVILKGEPEYVQPAQEIGYDHTTLRKYAAVKYGEGFLQIGYDVDSFQDIIDESIVGITKNRHVGETGYIVILDGEYKPVSVPDGFKIAELDAEADTLENSIEGETFEMKLGAEEVFARATKAEGYAIISIFPKAEAYSARTTALYINSFTQVLVFALMFAFIYLVIKRAVVTQMKKVNTSLGKITQGDLDEVVDVRSSEEFASLSDDINSTVTTLKGYISEAERRMEAELEFARTIQHSALPSVFPAYPTRGDFDVYALMETAKEVGGDFYDFYLRSSGNAFCILIADVSGKGIPAAMFMMRAKSLLKSLTDSGLSVTDAFSSANNTLCSGNDASMFVTVWEGIVDLDSGRMTYASAGHNPPAVRKRDGSFELLRSKAGFVMAGMEDVPYRENEYVLEPGDTIFLYTDGVTEAQNREEELFGEERMLKALDEAEDKTPEGLCNVVKAAINEFVGDAPQFDDITMLAFVYNGPEKK
ncbi:MAG: SpoIIE family protein phosphatase [Clostridia bacterium]|nr:SpoIIE family protein phosphatase [Clostridia bacterium]